MVHAKGAYFCNISLKDMTRIKYDMNISGI